MGGPLAIPVRPIHGFVGMNGSGKSLAAASVMRRALERGRTVLSTAVLLDPATGEPHANYVPLVRLSQLEALADCHVWLDEISASITSHQSERVANRVEVVLEQLRKRNCFVVWTAPDWMRAAKFFRRITQAVTLCTGFLPKANADGWPNNRMLLFTTYDAVSFEEFNRPTSEQQKKRLKRIHRRWYYRPRHDDQDWYESMGEVDRLVDDLPPAGACACCGGRISVPRCKCAETDCSCLSADGRPLGSGVLTGEPVEAA